jgi:hypothetical protein
MGIYRYIKTVDGEIIEQTVGKHTVDHQETLSQLSSWMQPKIDLSDHPYQYDITMQHFQL